MAWGFEDFQEYNFQEDAFQEEDGVVALPCASGASSRSGSPITSPSRSRPLSHYFQGFGVACRRLLRFEPFSSGHVNLDVSFSKEGADEPQKKAVKLSSLEEDAVIPFWHWVKNVITLQFNPDVRGLNQKEADEPDHNEGILEKLFSGLPTNTLFEKILAALVVTTGLVELTLFCIARASMLVVDFLDVVILKPIGKVGYSLLSQCMGWENNPNRYENRNTWFATFLKGTISLFTLPIMFVWHFAVSKPLSVTIYSESRASKVLYTLGLLLIVGLLIGFSFGLGSVPVFGVALAKMGFIQVAGDAIAAGFSSFLAPLTTAAFAEAVGLYFSWMAVVSAWKIIASAFLKLMSFGPVIREDLSVRSRLNKEAAFDKEAGFQRPENGEYTGAESVEGVSPTASPYRNEAFSGASQMQPSDSFSSEGFHTASTVVGPVESEDELSDDEENFNTRRLSSPSYIRS